MEVGGREWRPLLTGREGHKMRRILWTWHPPLRRSDNCEEAASGCLSDDSTCTRQDSNLWPQAPQSCPVWRRVRMGLLDAVSSSVAERSEPSEATLMAACRPCARSEKVHRFDSSFDQRSQTSTHGGDRGQLRAERVATDSRFQLGWDFSVTGCVPSAFITGSDVFRDTRLNVISPIVFRLVQYSPSSTRPSSCLMVKMAAPS